MTRFIAGGYLTILLNVCLLRSYFVPDTVPDIRRQYIGKWDKVEDFRGKMNNFVLNMYYIDLS